MRNKNWHRENHVNDRKKELFMRIGKKLSIGLTLTRHFKPVKISPVKFDFGITIRRVKRTRLQRLCFWVLRLRFKELTIKELKKLSSRDQKKYLDEKYYLYGIIPCLKGNVSEKS